MQINKGFIKALLPNNTYYKYLYMKRYLVYILTL